MSGKYTCVENGENGRVLYAYYGDHGVNVVLFDRFEKECPMKNIASYFSIVYKHVGSKPKCYIVITDGTTEWESPVIPFSEITGEQ